MVPNVLSIYIFSIQVKAVQIVFIFGEKKVKRLLPFSLIFRFVGFFKAPLDRFCETQSKYNAIFKENTKPTVPSIVLLCRGEKANLVTLSVILFHTTTLMLF